MAESQALELHRGSITSIAGRYDLELLWVPVFCSVKGWGVCGVCFAGSFR